jgi:hypothetical protein
MENHAKSMSCTTNSRPTFARYHIDALLTRLFLVVIFRKARTYMSIFTCMCKQSTSVRPFNTCVQDRWELSCLQASASTRYV